MRHGTTILTVLSALALAPRAQVSEQNINATGPIICDHNIQENEYICPVEVTVTIWENDNSAKIDCNGQLLDCSKLEQFSYSGNKTLNKLAIKRCSINSSLECVLAALNATGASTLFFQEVLTPVTEETVRGLDMLAAFNVYNGVQSTIPVEVLKKLPKLKMHRLHDVNMTTIPPNIFNQTGVPELTYLEISGNNITSLPADAFNGLKKLKVLNLFKNNFQEIDVNTFRGLDSLEQLYLNDNSMNILPSGLLVNTPLLKQLASPRNSKELRVQTGAISGLANLVELELSSYGGLKLESAALSNLPSLRTLKLKEAGITELPADLFLNTTAVVDLFLSNNKLRSLPESLFSSLGQLQKLDLSNNKLERVTRDTFRSLQELKEIYLDGNLIETLPKKLFSAKALTTVSLSKNRINHIDRNAFFDASSVTRLDLSHNSLAFDCFYPNISTTDEAYLEIQLHSPLDVLIYIEYLNLSHNKISNICGDWIEIMIQLKLLNLSFNTLTKITRADLNFVSRGIKVDLRDNKITTLELPFYESSKPNLLLARNPFHCDCHLYPFLNELNHLTYDVTDATCHLPRSLNGVALSSVANAASTSSSLSLANLTCPLPDPPDNCSCIVRPAENRTECDCDDIQNNTLPIPTHNGPAISQMMLTLRSVDHVHLIPEFVTKLNLSSIGLTTVPDVPDTVTFVDLTSNSLNSVPIEFLKRNIMLKLGENPFICDCWQTEDVKNLQKYRFRIEDYNSLHCTDGADVSQVHAERLCDEMRSIAIGTSLAVLGIIVAIAGALSYRYSLYIKVYLYNRGWRWLVPEERLDASKLFDIFISYHNADEKFVKGTLFPKLDKEYKVCIHSRDFIVGGIIPEQICLFVAQSRRTLIVISNDFLSDPNSWVLQEFEAVVMQTKNDRRPRAVVVVKGDVNFDNAPDLIKNHVKMNTYIKWGETMFWERLKYALPKKLSAKDVELQQSTKQAVESLCNGKIEGGLNVVLNDNGKLTNMPALKDASCV